MSRKNTAAIDRLIEAVHGSYITFIVLFYRGKGVQCEWVNGILVQ